MSVSSVGSAPPTRAPESVEPKGPDVKIDGDGDDAGGAKASAPTPATVPAGQGLVVNKSA